jgi:predicted N-acetyltransferase YhbS
VAVAPNDEYVSFAGMWIVPENGVAYIEPVATDPDYRRKGLGRAVVVETLRRVRSEGAATAHVGSDVPFYRSMGFDVTSHTDFYVKRRH